MIYTLEDLSNGKCAVINDGTLKELQAVLKHCFPDDNCQINGLRDYYFASNLKGKWNGNENVKLCGIPTQSVVEFYNQILKTMKQYLTRKQLIELHKADNCLEWKSIIGSYLNFSSLENDDYKVEIKQFDIDYANNKCNPKQTELLLDAGIVFKKEIAVCDSKDGDCIKVGEKYYVNRNGYIIVVVPNASNVLQIRYANGDAESYSPSIKGTLVKEPLTLQIKIN